MEEYVQAKDPLETPLGLAWLKPAHLQVNFPVLFSQSSSLGKAGDSRRGDMAAPLCQAVPLQGLPTQAPLSAGLL